MDFTMRRFVSYIMIILQIVVVISPSRQSEDRHFILKGDKTPTSIGGE